MLRKWNYFHLHNENNKNVKKLVFASSSEVYGEPLTNPIKEDAVTQGRTLYAVSKLAGEELIKAYKYEFKGFDYTILRYFNTYGPYQVAQFVIPRFIHRTLNDKSPVINGIGNQKRSYSFSSDTARATIDSLFSNKTNDVIMNIGNSNEPVTLLELANKIIQASGKKGKIKAKIKAKFLVISGKPINEEIARGGPFVMNTKAEILQAVQDYHNGTFVK